MWRRLAAGALALAFAAAHAAYHLARGEPWDLLWMCNVAPVLVGIGLLAGYAMWNAVGLLWLALGVPLWLLDLALGGAIIPTAFLTHLGGGALALFGARRLGVPRGSFAVALVALLALAAVSRFATPPGTNVNLVFSVWPGWERIFPSHAVYIAFFLALSTATFVLVERGFRAETR
jgi:hypothetical protein